MKRKTIKAVLVKKINDWIDSIDDENVQKAVKRDAIITGGCITSMLLNEPVNDYDVYFRTKETVKLVSEYYCKKFGEIKNNLDKKIQPWVLDGADVELWKQGKKRIEDIHPNWDGPDAVYENKDESKIPVMFYNVDKDRIKIMVDSDGIAGITVDPPVEITEQLDDIEYQQAEKEQEDEKYRPIFLTTNAITLSNKIQLVIRFWGEVKDIHSNYDFVHATCSFDFRFGILDLPARALEAIINKELFYCGSKYPICSVIRTRKFIKRGWNINAGQYLKMCFQISELDLTDIAVLEDQLVGVDSVYFMQVIRNLQKMKEENKIDKVDTGYVMSIIDKIF